MAPKRLPTENWNSNEAGTKHTRRWVDEAGQKQVMIYEVGREYLHSFTDYDGIKHTDAVVELVEFDNVVVPFEAKCRLVDGEGDLKDMELSIDLMQLRPHSATKKKGKK